MKILGLFVAVAVAAPAIAIAAEGENQDRGKQRRICRNVQHTGTRIRPPRVCLTREQWELANDLSQEDMNEWKNRPTPTDRSGVPR